MPDWYAEKSKYMYKHKQTGNTIIKEEIRQHKTNKIRQQMSTYLILIKKDFYPQTQNFLQPLKFKSIHLQSKEDAQNAPTPITTYALFLDGSYITNEQMNDKRFLKLLEK